MARSELQFIVGNTYQRVPTSRQKLDRTGRYRKEHDWTLFVDVVNGNPEIIERVVFHLPTFQPNEFRCCMPVKVKRSNGTTAWRFSTRQQSYGATNATLRIRGAGGTVIEKQHRIELDENASKRKHQIQSLVETRPLLPPRMLPMDDKQKFGIELELTSPMDVSSQDIAHRLYESGNCGTVYVAGSYGGGREWHDGWKIVPDGSIVCNISMPNCNTFELVSPILQGGQGLSRVAAVTSALNNLNPKIKVNRSMGYHVHVDVSAFSHKELIKVCQNFIKYEEVLDSFMPPSRRSGSAECNQFFKSNVESVNLALGGGFNITNKERHTALGACGDVGTLAMFMNQNGRYHKLNLQNIVTGRQPTLEFRQHSSTTNYSKISAWIRFCTLFVRNSARLASPNPCNDETSIDDKFDYLFMYVVKDRGLRNFYCERREQLASEELHLCKDDCRCSGVVKTTPVY